VRFWTRKLERHTLLGLALAPVFIAWRGGLAAMTRVSRLMGLVSPAAAAGGGGGGGGAGRGLHLSTFRLIVSAFNGIGGAFRGRLGVVYVVFEDPRGVLECILCQKRLRLS